MIRLDKFFTQTATLTRSRAQKAIKNGEVSVNGEIIKNADRKINPQTDEIVYNGEIIRYSEYAYIVMNKPQGVVSATDDFNQKTVIDLLPEKMKALNLFPCGRLDKDTTGLIVLTNDGKSAHNALSPKKHVEKKYLFTVADEYTDEDVKAITSGITLKDGYTTKPCKIEKIDEKNGYIYLTEGKYHEIKRLFGARGNKITALKRVAFGKITLSDLPDGEWRFMTEEEISSFITA